MTELAQRALANESVPAHAETIAETLLPDTLLAPRDVGNVLALPSFASTLRNVEHLTGQSFDRQSQTLQNAVIRRRLRQLVDICRVNPFWKERINAAVGTAPVVSVDAFQSLPITDKDVAREFFTGERGGMVVPIEHNGFQVAASGGTTSGRPSEIVYPLNELWDTYDWAGAFLGRHVIARHMAGVRWVATTLSDHMMWSSSTMVGGVLQRVPDINFIGAGAIDRDLFARILSYPGDKAIMGISRSIAELADHAEHLSADQRSSFRIALYGSGSLSPRSVARLREAYPNLLILSFFAAMEAETIGVQLDPGTPLLTAVPGLHFIEVVDDNGRQVDVGEEGELVVTRLFGNASPMLRYRLGDRAIRRPDRATEALRATQFEYAGRSGDYFALGSKRLFAPRVLAAATEVLRRRGLLDLERIADDVQLQIDHRRRVVRLLIVTRGPILPATEATDALLSQALLSGFVEASKFRTGVHSPEPSLCEERYRFSVELVPPGSPALRVTDVGKVPLLLEST